MKIRVTFVCAILFLLTAATISFGADAEHSVTRLTDRIIVVSDPLGGSPQMAINSQKGIVVFGTLWSETVANEYKKIIAEEFGQDNFVYIVNNNTRLDLVGGNGAYPGAFIIMQEEGYQALAALGKNLDAELRQLIDMWRWKEDVSRKRLPTHEAGSRNELIEKNWMESCKRRADEMDAGYNLVLPNLTFRERLTLDLGDITFQLIYFGKTGYPGTSLVYIPEEKLLIVSGFIMHPQHMAPHPHPNYIPLDVAKWLHVLEEFLVAEGKVDQVLCGINQFWTREKALTRYRYMKTVWDGVRKYDEQGLSLAEIQEKLSLDNEMSFVKEWDDYKGHGDEWFRPQNTMHVQNFYLQSKTVASYEVMEEYQKSGFDSAMKLCRELIARKADKSVYFDEAGFNGIGYYLLANGKTGEAVEVLKLVVELYPQSANAYDSLGEAYLKNGDKEQARINYEKSLELNPNNENAAKVLKEMN